MKVVDYGPQLWFFLQDNDDHYLSVRCQRSFSEFELLIRLTEDEEREYRALGRVYLDYLAARVSYWAQEYISRNENERLEKEVARSIEEWKTTQPVN